MKKLYALLLSLLTCSIASAQITITVDGEQAQNKGTLTKVYTEDGHDKVPGMPQLGRIYGLYPEILVTSQKKQDVLVTVIDKTQDLGTQFCYGTTCDELYKMNFTSLKTAKNSVSTICLSFCFSGESV